MRQESAFCCLMINAARRPSTSQAGPLAIRKRKDDVQRTGATPQHTRYKLRRLLQSHFKPYKV